MVNQRFVFLKAQDFKRDHTFDKVDAMRHNVLVYNIRDA